MHKEILKRFIREEEGGSMVEYVLLVALVGVVAISAMKFLGSTAGNKLNTAASNIANSN